MAKKKDENIKETIDEVVDKVSDVVAKGAEYVEATGEVLADNFTELAENVEIVAEFAVEKVQDAATILKDGVTEFVDNVNEKVNSEQNMDAVDKDEITIKTAKGLVGEPFKAKDGREYCEVKIPNKDENDKSPWATFVVRAAQIHDDKFGKGKWFKLPADGTTSISKSEIVGQDENGKNMYENTKERVTNTELKSMVEFYKERERNIDISEVPFDDKTASVVADMSAGTKSFKEQIKEAKDIMNSKNEKADIAKPKVKAKGQDL